MAKHKYFQGSNMPGYMPDSEPYETTSFKAAKECALEELEGDLFSARISARFQESADDREYYCNLLRGLRRAIRSLRATKRGEWGHTVSGFNRHYFISRG